MRNKEIVIQGARAHNLKNIDVNIPRDKLVVMTGFQDPENRHLLSIQFMQRDSVDMLSHFLLMPVSF